MKKITPKEWYHSRLWKSEHWCNFGASTHAASLPNAKWNFPGQDAASFQLGRIYIYRKPCSSTIVKNRILSHDRRLGIDFTTVYTVLKHAQMVGDVWNSTMQESRLMWPSSSKQNKFKWNVPKNFQTKCSSWKITYRIEIPVNAV